MLRNLLVMALLAGGSVACAGGVSGAESGSSSGMNARTDLGQFIPTRSQGVEISRAKEILTRECLIGYGFSVKNPVISIDAGEAEELVKNGDEAVFRSDVDARSLGFHAKSEVVQAAVSSVRESGEKESFLLVLNGSRGGSRAKYQGKVVSTYGCAGKADEILSSGVKFPFKPTWPGGEMDAVSMLLKIHASVEKAYTAENSVKHADSRWSLCLRKKTGLSYENPRRLARDSKWEKSNAPSAREISAARVSRACQLKDDYLSIVGKAEKGAASRVLEVNRRQVDTVRAIFDARIQNARCVLTSRDHKPC